MQTRVFSAEESGDLAGVVVDHDPGTPRQALLVPANREAATAGVRELAKRLQDLPKSIRSALKSATDNAGFLSDDRLQGLAELIQNADDLGATHAHVAVDTTGSRLLFGHDGAGLTLHDVWALAIPWLSLKIAEVDQLGRFGIGLKTLQSLSEVMEVSEGHLDVRLAPDTLEALEMPVSWPGRTHSMHATADANDGPRGDPRRGTVFSIPFDPGTLTAADVEEWLLKWGESGLVFLRHLSRISLIDAIGEVVAELQIEHDDEQSIELAGGETSRRTVRASDGRIWLVYARTSQTPEGKVRAGKAQGIATAIALAFPQFDGDSGHLHIGLPVREVGLPFRVSAQFDPQANRRDIADTDWNLALIPLLTDLWLDSVLDIFATEAPRGWAAVPLTAYLDADDRTAGRLRNALMSHLMTDARTAFAERVELASDSSLDGGYSHGRTKLAMANLACETVELTDLLSPDDIRAVADSEGTLAAAERSTDCRWRLVLQDLNDLGAPIPVVVDVVKALTLLEDTSRPPAFVARLVGIAVEAGCTAELAAHPCLILDDGTRAAPRDRTDLDVLLPAGASSLWDTLGIGSRLHTAHADLESWGQVAQWLVHINQLRTDASDHAALTVLSRAGTDGDELAEPLNDGQLDALRYAVGDLADDDRYRLGPGIGQSIRLDAYTFDSVGHRQVIHARPYDSYFTERDRLAWSVAAGKTPGLVWLDRRYTADLKRDRGRDTIGAQRLFRLLGAESAPRVGRHPANQKRYVYHPEGVSRGSAGSPARRNRLLTERQAQYTVQDWLSRDLDAVLANIAAQTDSTQRRRRSEAVLDTLTRAWDRFAKFSTVKAAAADNGWINKGQVEAWWISSASSIAWLTSESGRPTKPDALAIRSSVNVIFHGDDPDRYLDPALDRERLRPVLATLGVAGDPTVPQLLERLEEVRRDTRTDAEAAQDQAAPIYQALTTEIHGNRLGQLTQATIKTRFGAGEGLVSTAAGWRRPSVVLAGHAIFGSLREFVPAVSGTDQLWSFLGVPQPTATDAKAVLNGLAKAGRDEPMIMLNALRLLSEAPVNAKAPPGLLRRSAVWVGDRWTRGRPVYAILNPLIADALRDRIPIWTPGGALNQFNRLIDDYALTRLDAPHGEVQEPDSADTDQELTDAFTRAVSNLQADLAVSDPDAEASLAIPWDTLADFEVAILPQLRVRLVESTHSTDETVNLGAWLDVDKRTLYVADETAAGRPSAGGYAIAAAFGGEVRRISHDWVAAWAGAQEGIEADRVTTAAQIDAKAKQRRDEANQRLRELAEHGKGRRKTKRKADPNSSPPTDLTAPASTLRPPVPTRTLIDPDEFDLENEDGVLVAGRDRAGGTSNGSGQPAGGRGGGRGSGGLLDPDRANPKRKRAGGRGAQNFTGEEREEIGVRLVRRVLNGNEKEFVDIRHQRNVGADAVDDLENFYELKVYSGKIPDDVSLTSAEYLRAQKTEKFFLVLIGNVEDGEGAPELLIINDPIGQLTTQTTGSVRLTGRAQANVLSYTFRRRDLDTADEQEG